MDGSDTSHPGTLVPSGEWKVDLAHSSVAFEVRHMMIAKVRGRFDAFEGDLKVDDAGNPMVRGVIQTASLNTNEPRRDAHLRSADFFEVEAFPEIRFVSTRIDHIKGPRYRVVGQLTIRDVTREVELEAEAEGAGVDPKGRQRAGVSATGEINRVDFGLRWNQALETGGLLVDEKVKLVVDISAVRAGGA